MIVILGGGLAGSLLAYRLALLESPPEFLLIECHSTLDGQKTWSFHESDLDPQHLEWLRPLISQRWSEQEVRFRDYQRVFSKPYYSITSSHFSEQLQNKLGKRLLLNEQVASVTSTQVILESGKTIDSQLTFDARGFQTSPQSVEGYQKFVGMDLKLNKPHKLEHPVIMDTRCEQKEGYRFFYLLPWSSDSLLIEDTRYSTESTLNLEEFKTEIRSYCIKAGWTILKELRTEVGILPIPFEYPIIPSGVVGTIPLGMRGGYFHLTTGYSLPLSVRVADTIARKYENNPKASVKDIQGQLHPLQFKIKKQARFFSLLNKMLFLAAAPSERWRIFDRFYRLPEKLIFRFYESNLKITDQARILMGRPPVPIVSALRSILNFEKYKLQQGILKSEKLLSEK